MKDNNNIEELIKQKLSNFETEVSADVWDKIDKQLDQLQPTNNPGNGSDAVLQTAGTNVTTWVAGVGLTVVSLATIGLLLFSNTNETSSIVAENVEVVTPQNDVNETVPVDENQTEPIKTENELISNLTEEKTKVDVVSKKDENTSSISLVTDERVSESTEAFDRNDDLVTSRITEKNTSAESSEKNSSNSESGVSENGVDISSAMTNAQDENLLNDNNEVQAVVAQEFIEEKIVEQETLNEESSSIGPLPNIFTPNGDGINDHFIFATENIAELRVNIYSARGELVFVISGNDKWHWDGELRSGQSAASGNYYYAVYATGFDGKKHQKKGTLYLNR